ncbi:alpha/beta-type small acid-soluble spore protein [Paenibacillus oralis]|uniref:Alpha/beta-type small acid-soluble spore protein n=1 Tax=Paenibacillus oralis TaxID=2490856 RepID=A0A3P3TA09_9BACL|nr:alpha/beta-type small acid-soluble spore protein [Paenibacillus oralis]RRJ54782.1 alpha/beta-type small acid-soluble spore protein [Paenibacillus oralis]
MSKFEDIKHQGSSELDIPLPANGYYGEMSSRDTGALGGFVTRNLVQIGEQILLNSTKILSGGYPVKGSNVSLMDMGHETPKDPGGASGSGGEEPDDRSDEPVPVGGSSGIGDHVTPGLSPDSGPTSHRGHSSPSRASHGSLRN